jgi:hypothetical protein
MNRFGTLAVFLSVLVCCCTVSHAAGDNVLLFNGKDLVGWKLFTPDPNADVNKIWSVQDGVLCCAGNPVGYIRTTEEFEQYRLEFEWRWPEAGGNSGVLLHINGEDAVWPRSIESQLQDRYAGDFWVIGGAEFKEHTDPSDRRVPKKVDSNEKPVGEWNVMEIVCKDNAITVKVNGLLQNVATETTVNRGTIGFQSEGTPIEFRNVVLERLDEKTETAHGTVFEDRNADGVRDSNEPGVSGVLVSNQRDLVETDGEGKYAIEVDDDEIVFVVKPPEYDLPVNENNLPRFFYVHKPKGSPNLKYPGVDPTGPLPESIDFPLLPSRKTSDFDVVVLGDPQPADYTDVQFFRDDVVAEMIDEPAVEKAAFGVTLGDVVSNDLSLYEPYNPVIAQLNKAWYNVIGNHDTNQDVPVDNLSDETWERVFGPSYYAFFHGDVLFLNLDNIHWFMREWKNPKTDKIERRGGYIGSFGENQLDWVAKVLNHHDKDRLVVVMTHIPLMREWGAETQDANDLYNLLEGRKVLSLSAHSHTQEHVFTKGHSDSLSDWEIHHLINITACGSWWKGVKDDRGIPVTTTADGVDNGYTILAINGSDYTTGFKASGKEWDYQIRIGSPVGHLGDQKQVIANVFAGSSKSQVAFRIDDGPLSEMTRTMMADPFMERMVKETEKISHKGPLDVTSRNTHIWVADLPTDLEPGTHTVTVVEKDQYGNTHRQSAIFVVDE